MPTPGLLRSASVSVVAPCSLKRSLPITLMVRVVSSKGWLNLGEDNRPDEYTLPRLPSTWTASKSVASAAGPPLNCAAAANGAASTMPVSSDAVRVDADAPVGIGNVAVCLRLLMCAMGMPCVDSGAMRPVVTHRSAGRI